MSFSIPPEIAEALQGALKDFYEKADATRARPLLEELHRLYPVQVEGVLHFVRGNHAEVIRLALMFIPGLSKEFKDALRDKDKAVKFINELKKEIK